MKLKKALSIFLVLTMLLGTFAMTTVSADDIKGVWVDNSTLGYSESKVDLELLEDAKKLTKMSDVTTVTSGTNYQIADKKDLVKFAELVNAYKNFSGCTVYLTADIDNGGEVFEMDPIGKLTSSIALTTDPGYLNSEGFQGVFDGLGHTIDYLSIKSSGNGEGIALFGKITSAVIRNLVIGEHCVFTNNGTSGTERTAAVTAFAQIHSNKVGVKVADMENSEISMCYLIENVASYATLSAKAGCIGGIVGHIGNRKTAHMGVVRYASVYGDISMESSSGYVGSLAGGVATTGGTRNFYFYNCFMDEDVSEKFESICGLLGSGCVLQSGNIQVLYSADAIGYSYKNIADKIETGTDLKTVAAVTDLAVATNYLISDVDGLQKLAEFSQSTTLDGYKFYLVQDIDMKNEAMTPIGTSSYHFKGTFDGQGYVIDNLSISVADGYAGFFGVIRKATIRNVVFGEGCTFTGKCAGAVAGNIDCKGETEGATIIENCYSAATVVATSYGGGFVGTVEGSTNTFTHVFRNLTHTGSVTAVNATGGILGWATRPILVTRCRNAGAVSGSANVGALVGHASSASYTEFANNIANVLPDNGSLVFARNESHIYFNQTSITDGTDASWDKINFVGYQTKTEGGKVTAVRLLAVVNDLDTEIGFTLSAEGGTKSHTYNASKVYSSVLANEDGVDVAVRAETMGGKYLVAVTISGIPANGTTLTVVPFEGDYTGAAVVLPFNVA